MFNLTPKSMAIMLGVALLAPVSGAVAGGGSGTHGTFSQGSNANPNGGNPSSGSGSGNTHGSFPTGPNQNPNGGGRRGLPSPCSPTRGCGGGGPGGPGGR